MSTFTIHTISYDSEKKYNSGTILKHYIMNNWLETNGIIEYKYELHKDSKIHSIWKFNEKTQRWCRTATPSKKNITVVEDQNKDDYDLPKNDRCNRKKYRQEKAKLNKSKSNRDFNNK